MKVYTGTSGYSYPEWKGEFYPEKTPSKKMLSFYAQNLTAVEINNTFYRLPNREVLDGWSAQVPETFRFVLKASRRITHNKRLKEAQDETNYLIETAGTLREKLGVIFFQLPPYLKKDLPRLEDFIDKIGEKPKIAFEFRHDSWFSDDVYESLSSRSCALCQSDNDDKPVEKVIATTDWGYIRLRKSEYPDEGLAAWARRIVKQSWKEAFVFIKHVGARAPLMAQKLLEAANSLHAVGS